MTSSRCVLDPDQPVISLILRKMFDFDMIHSLKGLLQLIVCTNKIATIVAYDYSNVACSCNHPPQCHYKGTGIHRGYTTSVCTVLLSNHVNNAPYLFNSLCLSSTRKGQKMSAPQ